jgi:pyruvate-formate lyase-activating enzyme
LELYGKSITVEQAYGEVKKDKVFYETSGGGVTVSGGEPLFQPEFTSELLKICREDGIHTAIETSGFVNEDVLLSVIKYCDLILFDIKETDEELHKRYTNAPLTTILKNLNIINESKIPFIIRAPIIPTLNDRKTHFDTLRKIRDSLDFCRGIQIMPYHRTGSYKYELMNKKYICNDICAGNYHPPGHYLRGEKEFQGRPGGADDQHSGLFSAHLPDRHPLYLDLLLSAGHLPAQRYQNPGQQLYRLEVLYGQNVFPGPAPDRYDLLLSGRHDPLCAGLHD